MVLCLGIMATLSVSVACGDDDDGGGNEADRDEIVATMTTLAVANGEEATQEEIDFYLGHITDGFVQAFGTESLEACAEDAPTCIGSPLENPTVDPASVEIDGETATVVIESDEGDFGVNLVKDEGVWKADGLFVSDDVIGEGTEIVDVDLVEFAFEGDLESAAVKSGDFAFHFVNTGDQVHEAILIELPAEGEIEDLLVDESFEPEPIFVKFPYGPGDESDAALSAPLEPGRYGLVCFLPDTDDPEMTPHAFKGMVAEFAVE
jgi:hypothetical protein